MLGERPRPRFALYLVPALVGAWLIGVPHPFHPSAHGLKPTLYALGAATLWALGTVLGRYLSQQLAFQHVAALRFAFGLPASAIALLVLGAPAFASGHDTFWIAVLALVTGLSRSGSTTTACRPCPPSRRRSRSSRSPSAPSRRLLQVRLHAHRLAMGRDRRDDARRRTAPGAPARHVRVRAGAGAGAGLSRARHDLRRRAARRAPERAGRAAAVGARRARLAARRRAPSARRGGLVRAGRPRAADGRRGRRRRRRRRARGHRAVGSRAQRARLRAVRRDEARPRQLHARGDGDVQPTERRTRRSRRRLERVRAIVERRRRADDRHRLVRVGLPVRGRGRSRSRGRPLRAARRRRRARARGHDRRRDAAAGPPPRRARVDPRPPGRRAPAQHAQHRVRRGVGGARRRRVDPRRLGRRARRLPVLAERDRERRDGGSRLAARARRRARQASTSTRSSACRAWLEGVLGRRLEGSLYRAASWPA